MSSNFFIPFYPLNDFSEGYPGGEVIKLQRLCLFPMNQTKRKHQTLILKYAN